METDVVTSQWPLHVGSRYVKYKPCPSPQLMYNCESDTLLMSHQKCIQASLPQNFMNSGMEELNDLYSSPNIVRVINSRMVRWVGHVACMGGNERCLQGFFGET